MVISDKDTTRISKFISRVLRHQPETIGIELDESGWTDVATLIEQMNKKDIPINKTILQHIIATNTKKRFVLNETGDKIRAAQGHSVPVQLNYDPAIPPVWLYHGTVAQYVSVILQDGLKKQKRHSVHLSSDKETALKVGQRHGKPVVLQIAAHKMYETGFVFYISSNGVWLTDYVPPSYINPLQ